MFLKKNFNAPVKFLSLGLAVATISPQFAQIVSADSSTSLREDHSHSCLLEAAFISLATAGTFAAGIVLVPNLLALNRETEPKKMLDNSTQTTSNSAATSCFTPHEDKVASAKLPISSSEMHLEETASNELEPYKPHSRKFIVIGNSDNITMNIYNLLNNSPVAGFGFNFTYPSFMPFGEGSVAWFSSEMERYHESTAAHTADTNLQVISFAIKPSEEGNYDFSDEQDKEEFYSYYMEELERTLEQKLSISQNHKCERNAIVLLGYNSEKIPNETAVFDKIEQICKSKGFNLVGSPLQVKNVNMYISKEEIDLSIADEYKNVVNNIRNFMDKS